MVKPAWFQTPLDMERKLRFSYWACFGYFTDLSILVLKLVIVCLDISFANIIPIWV